MDDVIVFTKSGIGSRIYAWRKETIERFFAEAKLNHGLCYACMLGIQDMRMVPARSHLFTVFVPLRPISPPGIAGRKRPDFAINAYI